MGKDQWRIADEVRGAKLGDARLSRRLEILAETMTKDPGRSFPEACGEDDSALEAVYRFLSNEAVTPEAVLEPHYRATTERMSAVPEVLIVHDTTEFTFSGEREGMGRVQKYLKGFMGHFALAVSADGRREAMGVVGLLPVFRPWKRVTEHWRKRYHSTEKESLRWGKLIDQTDQRTGQSTSAIHVMDREADSYEILSDLIEHKRRFVIRARTDLRKTTEGVRLANVTEGLVATATREVWLSERKPSTGKKTRRRAYRPERTAKLDIRARSIEIGGPDRDRSARKLSMNVVHVTETQPPEGQDPVDWMLYTTEPVGSAAEVLKVVDHYTGRWVIEEYFKALKTGCAYEKRQLGTSHALLNALSLFVPIAWTLLLLRQQSRRDPSAEDGSPSALSHRQVQVLRAVLRRPLPPRPSGRDLLLAVAALGGHIKNNGDPGWLVLGRGFQRLLEYEVGWNAATSDQS
jgi:hypothetical protein